MIITRQYVDDYIKCPFLFGKKTVSNKYQQSHLPEDYLKIRRHISEIASYEMKNLCKLELSEYRIRFTNKYYTSKKDLMNMDSITTRLNGIFEPFSSNAFIGYAIPVEIPIEGTNIIYRNIIDYGLISDTNEITFVEIEQIEDITYYKKILKNWAHYYAVYSYLANEFGKKINLIVLDPITYQRIDAVFLPERYSEDYKVLVNTIKPLQNPSFVKNYHSCSGCILFGEC
jgi:hypothetical protein